MGWSRASVPDTIPLGCYMIVDQVQSKFFFQITVQSKLGKYIIEGFFLVTCEQKTGLCWDLLTYIYNSSDVRGISYSRKEFLVNGRT